jgi:hypothetical protein
VSNKLPSVTSDIPRDLRTFIDRLREIISGTGTSRLVSVQDLITGGIAGPGSNGTITPPTVLNIGTPPAPKNLTATGGVYDVFVEWDNPTYYGHDYTEVYGGATNVIGDAVLLGFTPGVNYVDTIGPSQSRYYWARFVNTLGTKGPFNSVTGTLGTTAAEVAHLLSTLTGAITQTQLFTDLGARINLIDGNGAGSVNTRIATETTNRTTADSAIVGTVTTLSATVGANTSAIQSETSTRVSETGSLFAKYTVKIDQNGYVSGFGLASTANNDTPFSDFIIRADRFSIASPTGPGITPVIPFIVTTTTTTINGVTVTPGVYINGAFIQGGTIQGASIAGGTIENAKLINVSANKITGAALEATSYIESAAYIAGSQGWKIHANGTAEFAAASIRGLVTAAQIDSRGLSIKDSSGNVIFAAGTPLSTTNITGLGALATQSTVAYSSVTGTPTLGALASQSTVNYSTQLTNVPSFGNFAYLSSITSANISTYIAGAAIGSAYISDLNATKITAGNLAVNSYIRSSSYSAGVSGWEIDGNGDAEFNTLTLRSGQIDGLLLTAYKINQYSGLFVRINASSPVSTTNGPYYLNGDTSNPHYLVYNSNMPAPATAPHKIFISVNVQAIGVSATRDLAVLVLINASISGTTITASEQLAYNTNSGTFGICTNATGVTTNTYATAVPVMMFVGGFNAEYTIQTLDGMAMGVR